MEIIIEKVHKLSIKLGPYPKDGFYNHRFSMSVQINRYTVQTLAKVDADELL